jgi:high-affinity nickel permease
VGTERINRAKRRRLCGVGGAIALLHLGALGPVPVLCAYLPNPSEARGLAYMFGLCHAFDVDHTLRSTTRLDGLRAMASARLRSASSSHGRRAGSWRRDRHATIPASHRYDGFVGMGVVGTSHVVGILNAGRDGCYDRQRLEQRLLDRGRLSRRLLGRTGARVRSAWHMYVGYGVTALFICTWVGSVLVWKHARLTRRWSSVAD